MMTKKEPYGPTVDVRAKLQMQRDEIKRNGEREN